MIISRVVGSVLPFLVFGESVGSDALKMQLVLYIEVISVA